MNKEKLKFYLNLVPPEIRDAVLGLRNEKHWAVYLILLEKGDTNFSAIGQELGLNSTDTINILRNLVKAGLVVQYTDSLTIDERRARSFYKVTPIGEGFIESLMNHFVPGTAPKKDQSAGTNLGLPKSRGEDLYQRPDVLGYSSTSGKTELNAKHSVHAVFDYDGNSGVTKPGPYRQKNDDKVLRKIK